MTDFHLPLATWLVTYLLHSTFFFGAAWAIDRMRLLRSPLLLEQLWRAALVGALLTATAQTAGVVDRVPMAAFFDLSSPGKPADPAARRSPQPPARGTVGTPMTAEAAMPAERVAASEMSSPAPAASSRLAGWLSAHGPAGLALLWLAGAGLLLVRLATRAWLARREISGRTPADAALAGELRTLCAAQRVGPPRLTVAAALAGPICLPNGEIVLPSWVGDCLDAPQRSAILAHELAHQLRRDPQWLVLTLTLDTLLWLQPLHRLARRRLVAIAELEADAWAARALADPRPLVESLAFCAERLLSRRIAQFSTGILSGMFSGPPSPSPLLERVDRLMKGTVMLQPRSSWPMRCAVLLTLITGIFLLPGCGPAGLRALGSSSSTNISVSDGGDTSVTMSRPGYALHMEAEGAVTFAADESDIATLEPGGELELTEKIDGVKHEYRVKADSQGNLARSYRRDGSTQPVDDASRLWLSQALPRMFRESGFDADARVARLLAKGGPELVLAEVDLAASDYPKASYLGKLLGTARLDAGQIDRALASAAKIGSGYELRRALESALTTQTLDGALWARLLQTAKLIDSDYEMAELLIPVSSRMPVDAGPAELQAWLDAALEIESDYELGRTLQSAAARSGAGVFVASVVARAGERLGSDYELRSFLESVAPRATDPAIAVAYLAAARHLESDYERRTALEALLDGVKLDTACLASALEAAAGMDSSYDKLTLLEKLAGPVAAHPTLQSRYREVARDLGDYERGEALKALDNASSR